MFRVFTINLLIALTLLIGSIPVAFGQQPQSYEHSMQSGLERFDEGDYISAKTYFEMALRLKKNDPSAQSKLSETIRKIGEQMERQERFYGHLDHGDRMKRENNLKDALLAYQKALEIFPDDKYVKAQLTEIKQVLANQEKKQADYDLALRNGQQLLENERYEESIVQFQLASTLFPDNELPKLKINEAKELLNVQLLKEAQFQQLQQEANQLILRKNYADAIIKIEAALLLYPNDTPTLSLLSETKDMLSKSDAYEKLLAKADAAYENKQLADAKILYTQALNFWPQQTYPSDMINRIDAYFQSDAYLNNVVLTEHLEAAEAFYNAKDWHNAQTTYNKVLDIDPENILATERLIEIAFFIKENEELAKEEEQLNQLIAQGDLFFEQQSYTEALSAYNAALIIQQNNEIIAKIEQTNKQLALMQAQLEKEERYQNLLLQADRNIEREDFPAAKTTLEQAIALLPEKEEAPNKLATLEIKIAELLQHQAKEKAYQLAEEVMSIDRLNGHLLKSGYFRSEKQLEKAEQVLLSALQMDAKNSRAIRNLAFLYVEMSPL